MPFLFRVNHFRSSIERRVSTALGRKVDLGNLKLSLSSGSLTAETLAIADDPEFSNSPFLRAKSVSVDVELLPLLLGRTLVVPAVGYVVGAGTIDARNNLDFKMVATVTGSGR